MKKKSYEENGSPHKLKRLNLSSVLSHKIVKILGTTPRLSNVVSIEPITSPHQFYKGKVGPPIKISFKTEKGHQKLISAETLLRLVRCSIQNH